MKDSDTLEKYFSERLYGPLKEWQREASTNREFYLGEKEFEFIPTVCGHEPVINYPTE
jgi:hypothetical protein